MPIEFDITLTEKDMYRFNMYQLYSGFQGWFSLGAAVFAFVAAVVTYGEVPGRNTFIYVLLGLFLLIYMPFNMILRAKQRFRATEELRQSLHYAVGEKGVTVSRGEENGELPWEQIYKMVSTKSAVYVYSNRINAFVIPREQLGECYSVLAELAGKKLPKHRVKMK